MCSGDGLQQPSECPGTASHPGRGMAEMWWHRLQLVGTGPLPGHSLAVQGQQGGCAGVCAGPAGGTGCCCASGSPASAPGDEQCWPRCRDCPCQPGCPCSRVTVPACATEFTQPLGCPVPPVHSLPARAAAWHCLGKAPGKIWRKSQPADRRELELAAVPAQSKIIPKALKQWYCSCFLCLCVLSADF